MRDLKRQDRKKEVIPQHLISQEKVPKDEYQTDNNLTKTDVIEKETDSKVVANYEQTGSNHEQTGSKLVAKPVANHEQTSSKLVAKPVAEVVANYEQTDSNHEQTGSKLVAQPVAEVVANYEQTDSKLIANYKQTDSKLGANRSFQELTGIQKKLTIIIYNACKKKGERISPPITVEYLSEIVKTSIGTIKNAILRLQRKNILTKEKFKSGRGGWTQYKLNDITHQDLLQYEIDSKVVANYEQTGSKLEANYEQTGSKLVAQPVAQPVATSSSSSSSNIVNNNTTTTQQDKSLGIWIPDNLREVGFDESKIRSIFKQATTPPTTHDLQSSLDAFSYDLENGNVQPRTGPLNFFIGILLNSGNYISDRYLMESKKEVNAYLERRKELEVSREDFEKAEEQKKFEQWLSTIPEEKRSQIVPTRNLVKDGGGVHLAMLKDYWEKEINSASNV